MKECIRLKNSETLDCQGDWLGSDNLCDCMFPDLYECLKSKNKLKGDKQVSNEIKVVEKTCPFGANSKALAELENEEVGK